MTVSTFTPTPEMRIAALQFDCKIGDVKGNIDTADLLLKNADTLKDIDLLVGPELGLIGYNFPSLESISPYLEPSCGGSTAWWAWQTARRYNVIVSIGYAEITTDPNHIPKVLPFSSTCGLEEILETSQTFTAALRCSSEPNYWTFNSILAVDPTGRVLAHYRKTHLYYTDASWASPSIDGFITAPIRFSNDALITTSFAICMDLNPRAFTANWTDYEVASHTLTSDASLLVVSTAWMNRDEAAAANPSSPCCTEDEAEEPNMETISYWIERLAPLIKSEKQTTVVIANRVGNEVGIVKACDLEKLSRPQFKLGRPNSKVSAELQRQISMKEDLPGLSEEVSPGIVSESAHYAGCSLVMTMGNEICSIYGILGRGVEDVLVANTMDKPLMTFILRQRREGSE